MPNLAMNEASCWTTTSIGQPDQNRWGEVEGLVQQRAERGNEDGPTMPGGMVPQAAERMVVGGCAAHGRSGWQVGHEYMRRVPRSDTCTAVEQRRHDSPVRR
jgi:hypothetical protein